MTSTIAYITLNRDVRQLRGEDVADLAGRIRGGLIRRGDALYDDSRRVWNGMVDRQPALIARCTNAGDVQAAVRFAAAHAMLLSIRGGGHHIAGNAVAEGGLMIDLSAMKSVQVDVAQRTARVGAGALLSDFDHAAQAHGLATPLGINSTTGVAGLTLGGGFGWLTRRHGLTIDNLIGASVVTADGQLRRASADSESELFWALRGGGGNFGVVTGFEYRLHPVGPEVWAGFVAYPFEQARQVLRAWREFQLTAGDDLTVWAVLRKAPPLPFLPEAVHGREVVIFAMMYAGPLVEGERATAPVLGFGTPIGSALGAMPYLGFQSAFDPLLTPGARNYWKSHDFAALSDAALDQIIDGATRLPTPECEIFIGRLGGAMGRVPAQATAYAGRQAQYVMNLHGRNGGAADDSAVRNWARRVFDACAPYATGGGYVNFLTEDEADRVAMSYGVNLPRLQAIKQQYDPGNLFRMNLNITPRASRALQPAS